MALTRRRPAHAAPRIGKERRHRGGRHPRPRRVRPRRQHDRHAGAQHDAGAIGLGEIGEILCQHVAGFEIRHDQDLRPARDLRLDALDPRGFQVDGVVEGERSVEQRRR